MREFIQMFLDQRQEVPRRKFQLAATLKTMSELIGNCGIRMRSPDAFEADIAYGFTHFKLHRIWSWCVADNVGSAHVLEKVGMRQEGRLRENEYYKDRWWDTLMYGVLENEWRALSHKV